MNKNLLHKILSLVILFSGLLLSNSASAATTIFSDSFNNDYGELSTHTPTTVGTSWTQLVNNGVSLYVQSYNNHVNVQSNTANGGSIYVANGTYPNADYEISIDALFAAGDSNYTRSLILRAQDSNNMYLLRSSHSTMTIYKRVSGTWTSLGSGGSVGLSDNTNSPYYIATLTFSALGTTLTGKVNGVTKVTVTDSSITDIGKAGIGLGYTAVSTDDGGTGVAIDTALVQTTASDSTAPTITSVSSDKANGSYTVGEVIDIDVTFSETVTSTGDVTVTLETGDTDRTCTFSVSSATTGTCNYTVQAGDTSSDLTVSSISGTIADTASNAMVNFVPTTNLAANKALVIDTLNPTLQSLAPADNETNFSPTSVFLMTFNQAVDVETGNITIKKTFDDSTVETIDVTSGLVTGTGTTVITIDPSTNLSDLTEYYILVDATAFDDAAGNSYAGISSTTAWSFITGDINAPTISSISSSVERTSASITWTTNESSSSQVAYGLTSSYGETTTEADTSTRVTSHTVSISGLTCATSYNFKVISKDAAGYTSADNDTTLTTSVCAQSSTSSSSAQSRINNLVNMGKINEAKQIANEFPNTAMLPIVAQVQVVPSTPIVIKKEKLEVDTPKTILPVNMKINSGQDLKIIKSTQDLKVSHEGKHVRTLQEFLISENKGPASEILKINGPTHFFGPLTKNALTEWQQIHGLKPDGVFGQLTSKAVNDKLSTNKNL